jgi:DNA-binding MarR family transcriptional regulator
MPDATAPYALPRMSEAPLNFDPIAEAGRQWRDRWGEEPVAPMTAVTSIMRVQQILLARLNAALEPLDLTFPRYEALMLLFFSRNGALPLGKMGARLQVHRTSMTNLMDGLARAGYATRVAHPTDRRTTLAEITPRGREVAEQATESLHAIRFGVDPLDDSSLTTMAETLERIRAVADGF